METIIVCAAGIISIFAVGYWVERITIRKNEKWKVINVGVKEIIDYLTEEKEEKVE